MLYTARPRGEEIAAWLAQHPNVTRFVILDDDKDMLDLLPHLVHCDNRQGVTDELASEVIRRLNAKLTRGDERKET